MSGNEYMILVQKPENRLSKKGRQSLLVIPLARVHKC